MMKLSMSIPLSICALLTSFNRRDSTLRCLELLENSAAQAGVSLRAVLVDDGSTDGTAQEVTARFSWVTVIIADGSLFWNRGMYMAMEHALDDNRHDFLLWLNDDTHLLPDALISLLKTYTWIRAKHDCEGIVVGATCDAVSKRLSYSGHMQAGRWRPLTFLKIHSHSEPLQCHTMNGNVVLIPVKIARDVGNLDMVFEHSMGDLDYGLRARSRGHPIYVAQGFVGHCSNNPQVGTHRDENLTLSQRWRKITSRKELPINSWLQLTRRHGGVLWPFYFVWPYFRVVVAGFVRSVRCWRF